MYVTIPLNIRQWKVIKLRLCYSDIFQMSNFTCLFQPELLLYSINFFHLEINTNWRNIETRKSMFFTKCRENSRYLIISTILDALHRDWLARASAQDGRSSHHYYQPLMTVNICHGMGTIAGWGSCKNVGAKGTWTIAPFNKIETFPVFDVSYSKRTKLRAWMRTSVNFVAV